MKAYHDSLTKQANERKKVQEREAKIGLADENRHLDVMADTWGKPFSGGPRDGPLDRALVNEDELKEIESQNRRNIEFKTGLDEQLMERDRLRQRNMPTEEYHLGFVEKMNRQEPPRDGRRVVDKEISLLGHPPAFS